MDEYANTDDDLISNPAPRCACVLLLDTSQSMQGAPIESLNLGVRQFFRELGDDEIAQQSVEVAIITFGGPPKLVLEFKAHEKVTVPQFTAVGATPMGEAVDLALKVLSQRLMQYQSKGLSRLRPLIILMTDGQPTNTEGKATDEWKPAANKLRNAASKGHKDATGAQVCCVAIGDNANLGILAEFGPPGVAPIRVKPGEFGKLFKWFSVYLGGVVHSVPGAKTTLDDW